MASTATAVRTSLLSAAPTINNRHESAGAESHRPGHAVLQRGLKIAFAMAVPLGGVAYVLYKAANTYVEHGLQGFVPDGYDRFRKTRATNALFRKIMADLETDEQHRKLIENGDIHDFGMELQVQ